MLGADLQVSEPLPYADLLGSAQAIASALGGTLQKGDRVLLAFDNSLEAVRLFWGCMVAGVIAIPAPAPDLTRSNAGWRRLQAICRDARVALAVTHRDHLEAARARVPDVPWSTPDDLALATPSGQHRGKAGAGRGDEVAYLQYTSGSTGNPRGVAITHANVLAQCDALLAAEHIDPVTSRSLTWLPWFHDYGLVHGLLMPVYTGTPSLLMPTRQFMLRPLRWLEAIARHRITHCGAPDFAYEACVQALEKQPDWTARLDHWKLATCGAEPIRPRTLRRFAESFGRFGFHAEALAPSYGLAEAVLAVSLGNSREVPAIIKVDGRLLEQGQVQEVTADTPEAREVVGSGRVLPGLDVCIVQPDTCRACPPDEVGEIWVRGPSVARGYWGHDGPTQERFGGILRDSEGSSGSAYLRTGDLGFLKGRELFVTGRHSDLIVVNGRNIHPQDLEQTAQLTSTWVRPTGVVAIGVEHSGRERAVLLAECRRQITAAEMEPLKQALRQSIADHHELDLLDVVLLRGSALPRTSSGKLQRRQARQMYLDGELTDRTRNAPPAPATDGADGPAMLEDAIARLAPLWAEVLHLKHVPPDGHFLALGGDSLTGTQLLSRVKERLGIVLPISALFADPTLRGMAKALAERQAAAGGESTAQANADPTPPAAPAQDAGHVLSFSQERMWFMQQLAPDSSAYNVPLALRLRGPLDADALQQSLQVMVTRHDILRTRFASTDQGPSCDVLDNGRIFLARLEAPFTSDPLDPGGVQALVDRLSREPFDLDRWPLMRAWLVRTSPEDQVLLLVLHHIVADQWSFAVMGRELASGYQLALAGMVPEPSDAAPRYADYARWHRRWFEGERRQRETAYWTRRLADLKPVALPTDFPRPRQPSFRGASLRLPLPTAALNALTALAAAENATLAMALLALFKVFLLRHSGQTDLAVGLPIANRHHPASENLVGSLVNTLVVRTSLDDSPDFLTVLRRVRTATLEAYEHQDMPFELLVRTLDPARDLGQQPLFNVMFNVVNTPVRDVRFEGLEWSRMDVDRGASQVDLTLVVDPVLDRSLVLEYATDLFRPDTVRLMGQHLLTLLDSAATLTARPVSAWPMLDDQEQQKMLGWGRGRKAAIPDLTLASLLEGGLQRQAAATALVCNGRTMSYRELGHASSSLAGHLRTAGFSQGHRIGICLPRGTDMVVALLATIRTGATYVPLDPGYPPERLVHQMADAELSLIVGHRETLARWPEHAVPALCLDEPWSALEAPRPTENDATAPAYLIYTSGSTGRPKGVAVPQEAVVNFLLSMAREPGLGADDRLLAVTTLGFDIAVLELLLPLSVGATIVLATEAEAADGHALMNLIDTQRVTLMQATPSRWHLLLEAGWAGRQGMRALVGGESLSPELASALLQRCDAAWNMYGPTETTVWSSGWRVMPDAPVALGKAIDNTQILVLDESGQAVPAGAWGEIWIGGAGVASGYWRQPALTAERFRTLPSVPAVSGERFYRTGDRGRWRRDGTLEHGGRLDDQVKLRGFRIELGEVQACLERQSGVRRCVVVVREDRPGDQQLVAYLVTDPQAFDSEAVRDRIRRWLPEHMVPTHLVPLPELPVLPNGKVDRPALPRPTLDPDTDRHRRRPPHSDTERHLWQIWHELLQRDDFGVDDSFFDLGGHSMLAVRMLARIGQDQQGRVPLHLLFEQPTIAALARHLAATDDGRDRPLVVLRTGSQPQGLFLLAGARMYQALAQRLDIDMPVYGLFSQTEIDLLEWPVSQPLPTLSVESMADSYLRTVRERQPHGPYFLGGFSIGGIVAYEVARRLQQQGEQVALLVMLDCALPGRGWKYLKAGLVRRWRLFRLQGWRHLVHLLRQARALEAARAQPGGRRNQAYAQAIRDYRASVTSTPVAFFQAAGDPASEPAYGWSTLASNMVIERVPGRHMDMLEPSSVSTLAQRLGWHLTYCTNEAASRVLPADSQDDNASNPAC